MPVLQRFKGAAFGLGITLVPIAAIACVQFLFASHTLVAAGWMNPEIDTWAVASVRRILAAIYAVVALIIAAYWLLVATLGRGQFLRIKSANIVLVLSGLLFALAMVDWSSASIPGHELFKGLCPVLGLSDEGPNFGFHLSRCKAFTGHAVMIVFLCVPLILLITSAILRIVVSRRRDGDGAASAVHP